MATPQQLQAEGCVLRFPEALGLHPELKVQHVMEYFQKAIPLATKVPFTWGYIDQPQDGQTFIAFFPSNNFSFNDGIRWLDEKRYSVPAGPREIEVTEARFGFIPGVDSQAYRVRRRFRLLQGGHPSLVLIHYSRGPINNIPPAVAQVPVRNYPLRPVNEPPVFVMGDRAGQKAFPPGANAGGGMGGGGMGGGMGGPGMGGGMNAMAGGMGGGMGGAHHPNAHGAPHAPAHRAPHQPRDVAPDSDDEGDLISSRTLSMTRYRRNHEIMNEVFACAAFGKQKKEEPEPSPYSIFDKKELEEKTAKLQEEIEALKTKGEERRAARAAAERESAEKRAALEASADVAMEGLTPQVVAT
ncbi:hypothetical protein EV715DRAFT_200636 [Schizophyllum commune]